MKITVKNAKFVELNGRKDPARGDLFVAEAKRTIPFLIKRVYFINHLGKVSGFRGDHAHKKMTQVFFAANGSFVLGMDDGKRKQNILLNNPAIGLSIGPELWHTMGKFSKDCVILVFADDYYKERDYIRSYDDFLKFIKK